MTDHKASIRFKPPQRPTRIFVQKASGETETFSKTKLARSLIGAGYRPKPAKQLVDDVNRVIYPGISTFEIHDHVQSRLRLSSNVIAYRYGLKRALFELGPTGFPFERLIERLFQAEGFKTRQGMMVKGRCVQHEVDVIARKDQSLHWVECKFHQDQGTVCDLKTALYIFGRYIDLNDHAATLPETKNLDTQMWIVTNTRFSKEAIQLSTCRKVNLLGWGYPEQNNLQHLLEKHRLFPITCATALKGKQIQLMMNRGMVTCADLLLYRGSGAELGLKQGQLQKVQADLLKLHEASFEGL